MLGNKIIYMVVILICLHNFTDSREIGVHGNINAAQLIHSIMFLLNEPYDVMPTVTFGSYIEESGIFDFEFNFM